MPYYDEEKYSLETDYDHVYDRLLMAQHRNLVNILTEQSKFSLETFGPGERTQGLIDHITKELEEIRTAKDGHDIVTEWIDIAILAFDGAWRSGATPEQICQAYKNKLKKNMNRKWPDWRTADPNKAIEHIKGIED